MWMHTLFTFHGRIRRSEWWLTRLVLLSAVIAMLIVVGGLDATVGGVDEGGPAAVPVGLLMIALFGVMVWIDAAAGVKRLHDQDMSGWMYLLVLLPVLGGLFALIVFGIMDGTHGPNDHGPSAKYPDRSRLSTMLFD